MHIIDQGKSSKEELLNKPTCMKQILQKANHFFGVSLASKVKVLGKKEKNGFSILFFFFNLVFDFSILAFMDFN